VRGPGIELLREWLTSESKNTNGRLFFVDKGLGVLKHVIIIVVLMR
jgi:hypothetical protein